MPPKPWPRAYRVRLDHLVGAWRQVEATQQQLREHEQQQAAAAGADTSITLRRATLLPRAGPLRQLRLLLTRSWRQVGRVWGGGVAAVVKGKTHGASALFPLLFGCLVYPVCGLNPSPIRFAKFLGIITLESFTAQALGLAVGSMAPTTEAAMAIGPAVMLVWIVFGGYYVNAVGAGRG
ncbi:ABC transporter G family member 7 [Tetrabaena socialis]|uniref:ABC transporter G family member 7 n=1 Tax=Tetrabaena socialis TaxID=47790 RepID=A0A2J8AGX3_9CHLO|nr:ABC transporter G family member 7 [Tetrabaena socialis]|eukprot:PNH11770.1 ABC transporter G family member 7 [Tetrabaena socialis]